MTKTDYSVLYGIYVLPAVINHLINFYLVFSFSPREKEKPNSREEKKRFYERI